MRYVSISKKWYEELFSELATELRSSSLRIEITGPIASGKTTLAQALATQLGWVLATEVPELVPFWAETYSVDRRYQFEKDLEFLLFHAVAVRQLQSQNGQPLICDFSFLQDLAYAKLSQTPEELSTYRSVHEHFRRKCGAPSLIINLSCSTHILLARIVERGRIPEQGIQSQFLEALALRIDEELSRQSDGIPIVEVNSENVDFRNDATAIAYRVLSHLPERLK